MKKCLTKLFILTLAVAMMSVAGLSGGGGWSQTVAAQTGDGSVKFVSYASVGLVPGERVRFSVANPETASGTLMLSVNYNLAHQDNSSSRIPLYESEWMRVSPGEFRSSEFARKDLDFQGEPMTGRAQLLVGVSMMVPAGSDPEDFPVSMEIINDEVREGQSAEIDTNYRLIIVAARRSNQIAPVSFLPGERMRYTVYNPNEEGSKPARITTYTYDSTGNLLRQTDPVELWPGEGHIFDLNRDDLPLPGEDRSGRLQVRTVIQMSSIDNTAHPVKLHVTMEQINRAGASQGGSYYTGTITVSGDG